MVSIDDLGSCNWAFQRTDYWISKNPRWLRSAIFKIDMTSFFSAEGGQIWIKFRRLVQNDIARCKNSIRHIENRLSSYLIFLFLCSLGFDERRLSYRLRYTSFVNDGRSLYNCPLYLENISVIFCSNDVSLLLHESTHSADCAFALAGCLTHTPDPNRSTAINFVQLTVDRFTLYIVGW